MNSLVTPTHALFDLFACDLCPPLILASHRMSHVFMSSRKINPRGCCWRQRLSRTMDIKNNKVGCQTPKHIGQLSDIYCRYLDSVDRDQWHGYGAKFSRSRRLRGHLVRLPVSPRRVELLTGLNRDFVSHVQQQLMALGPGKSRLNTSVLR